MSTKAETIRNPDSCLNRAEFDEPVFVLRASDPCAALVVEQWAHLYQHQKAISQGDRLTQDQHAKFEDALDVAARMRTWAHLRAQRT